MPPILVVVGAAIVGAAVAVVSMRRMMKTPGAAQRERGMELSRRLDTRHPREVAVGLVASGGSGAYSTVSGAENKFAWRVTALSDYLITGFRELRLDGEKVTLSGDPMAGWVNVTSHYLKADNSPTIRLRIKDGAEDQVLDPELAAAAGPTSLGGHLRSVDRFAGVAHAILRLETDDEAYSGRSEPEAVYVFEGAPVHDPGHEGSDPDDPATWPTDTDARFNPALITAQAIRGWRRNGEVVVGAFGITAADIPDAQLQDAAEACDELELISEPGEPEAFEPRYRAGGYVTMEEGGIRRSLDRLLASMDGSIAEVGGRFLILPGVARAPDHAFDMQAIGGRIVHFDPHGAATQRYNSAVTSFVDPDSAWTEQDLPPYENPEWKAADGDRENVLKIALDMVYSRFQAGRIQKAKIERSRKTGKVVLDLPLSALAVDPGDWFTLTDERVGLAASVWEADSVRRITSRDRGARVIIEASEIDANPWQWDSGDVERVTRPLPVDVYPVSLYPRPPVPGLTLSPAPITSGGSVEPGIAVTPVFDADGAPLETHVEVQWRRKDAPERLYSASFEKGAPIHLREGILAGVEIEVRARLTGGPERQGEWSEWEPVTAPADYRVPSATDVDGLTRPDIEGLIDDAEAALGAAVVAVDERVDAANARADGIEADLRASRAAAAEGLRALSARLAGQRGALVADIAQRRAELLDEIERIDALIVSVGELELDQAEADALIGTLQTAQAEIVQDIDGLTASITALAEDLTTLQAALTAVQGDADDNAAAIIAANAAITALDQALTTFETDLDNLTTTVTSQGQSLDAINLAVGLIEDEFAEGGRIPLAEADITENRNGLAEVVLDLEGAVLNLLALAQETSALDAQVNHPSTGLPATNAAVVTQAQAQASLRAAMAEALRAITAQVAGVRGQLLAQTKLSLENDKASASALTALQIALEGVPGVSPGISAQVVTLAQALLDNTDPDNPVARAVWQTIVEASGSDPAIGGWFSGPDGSLIDLAANRVVIRDPSDNSYKSAIIIEGGVLKAPGVVVDTLDAAVVTAESVESNSIGRTFRFDGSASGAQSTTSNGIILANIEGVPLRGGALDVIIAARMGIVSPGGSGLLQVVFVIDNLDTATNVYTKTIDLTQSFSGTRDLEYRAIPISVPASAVPTGANFALAAALVRTHSSGTLAIKDNMMRATEDASQT